MDRRDIEIFLMLVDELHFGRAAERLLVSQARVSQTIKKLERQLGVTLFVRTSRRVSLTPVGSSLAVGLRDGWARIDAAVEAARAAGRGVTDTLRVGLEAPAVADLAAEVFERFRVALPQTEVVFRETGFVDPLDLLRTREVDVTVTNAPVDEADFEQGPEVFVEPVVLAVAKDHPLAGRTSVALADLTGLVVLRAGRRAAPYWDGSGVGPATLQELLATVAAGGGVSPLAAHAADYFARPTLAMVPFRAGAPPVRWVLAWRRGERTAGVDALAAAAAAAAAAADGDRGRSPAR